MRHEMNPLAQIDLFLSHQIPSLLEPEHFPTDPLRVITEIDQTYHRARRAHTLIPQYTGIMRPESYQSSTVKRVGVFTYLDQVFEPFEDPTGTCRFVVPLIIPVHRERWSVDPS